MALITTGSVPKALKGTRQKKAKKPIQRRKKRSSGNPTAVLKKALKNTKK